MSSEVLDSYVDVPGGKIFVRRWRPDACSQSPIVLLHDSLGCVDMWRDFPAELAQVTSREVIAYDRLGFGKSTPREGLPSVSFISEEADIYFPAIRSALGIDRFVLFGHSVGGAMAVAIAAAHRDDCDAVITESAQACVEERTLSGIRTAKEQFSDPEQFNKLARWHGDKTQWVLAAWTETWLSPPFRSWSLEPHLSQVTCPVLAIHGDLDEYGSVEFPRRIAGGVSGPSQLMILESCGHVPHRERKRDVLHGTAAFLQLHARR
ncbi:MAG TPA: alpha/beta hydrolase [Steroidobacter sp.]|uniref:alpha/beta fold hydrolase n=1 Tax=Steroidobacter sp. TaxID=1978227 RepID=UPI002ED9200F